jgi:hypothetical protein
MSTRRGLATLVCVVIAVLVPSTAALAAPTAPTVTATAATDVLAESATLNGTVNPEGATGTTTFHFEYGPDTAYGSVTEEVEAYPGDGSTDGTQDIAVSASAAGLMPNRTYHYRLVASNAEATVRSADRTLTTAAAPPAFDDFAFESVSTATATTATITEPVNPRGSATSYHVEYGTTPAYGSVTAPLDAGDGNELTPFTAELTGLTPGTVYYYRVVADNGTGGPVYAQPKALRTDDASLVVSEVSATRAKLDAVLSGFGTDYVVGTYWFEYGPTNAYGSRTPDATLPLGLGHHAVDTVLGDLAPGTTYHIRAVSTAGAATTVGADQTFMTAAAPEVTLDDIGGPATGTVTLRGTVDAKGVPGATYRFSVQGTTGSFATATAALAVPADGAVPVSAQVTGLPAGTHYLVRLTLTSGGRETATAERAFETVAASTGYVTPPGPVDVAPLAYLRCPPACVPSLGTREPATAAPTSRPRVLSSSVKGAIARLRIAVGGAGRLTVTGNGVTAKAVTVGGKTTKTVVLTLTRQGKRRLAAASSGRLRVTARVRLVPARGDAASSTKTITFKRGAIR